MANQSQAKYKRLIEKAEELFWKYGYIGVSVDQIAAEAGISKMTVYKHFPSKEHLLMEALKNNTVYHTDIIMEKINQEYHSFEKIEWLYSYIMQISDIFPGILARDIMDRPNIVEKIAAFKQEKVIKIWRHILEDGIVKGEIRPLDVDFVSNFLMFLPNFLMKQEFYTDERMRNKMLENLFDFMKYGLLGRKETCQTFKD
jgi:AcrR family transcriptional regulator